MKDINAALKNQSHEYVLVDTILHEHWINTILDVLPTLETDKSFFEIVNMVCICSHLFCSLCYWHWLAYQIYTMI